MVHNYFYKNANNIVCLLYFAPYVKLDKQSYMQIVSKDKEEKCHLLPIKIWSKKVSKGHCPSLKSSCAFRSNFKVLCGSVNSGSLKVNFFFRIRQLVEARVKNTETEGNEDDIGWRIATNKLNLIYANFSQMC